MTTGITSTGFVKKTRDQIKNDIEARLRTAFGNDVDLSSNNILGQLIDIQAETLGEQWDAMEALYYSRFGATASGIDLDRTYFPIERKKAEKADGRLSCTTLNGGSVAIPVGSVFSTDDDIEYVTTIDHTIAGTPNDKASIVVEAREAGTASNVPQNKIINIRSNLPGLLTVNNDSAFTNGTNTEDDVTYRTRATKEVLEVRNSSTTSIINAIKAVPGVNAVHIEVNETDVTDETGIPPRGFRATVEAIAGLATTNAIAEAIFRHKSIATPTAISNLPHASNETVMVSFNDQEFPIHFVRPTAVEVTVTLALTVNSKYKNAENKRIIGERITELIGGIYESGGTVYPGLGVGASISYWQIIGVLQEQNKPTIPGIVSIGDITLNHGNINNAVTNGSISFTNQYYPTTNASLIKINPPDTL